MMIFNKGSKEQKRLSKSVKVFLINQGFDSVYKACKHSGYSYGIITNQLSGRTHLSVELINAFVKEINSQYSVEIVNKNPVVTNRKL